MKRFLSFVLLFACIFSFASCSAKAPLAPQTEPVTDPVTEPITEPITEPVTEPVTEAPNENAGIYLDADYLTITEGERAELSAIVVPVFSTDSTELAFSVTGDAQISISVNGERLTVSAYSAGKSTLNITTKDGTLFASIPVTVKAKSNIKMVNYPASQVRHIFTHCLIAYPEQGCGYKNAPLDADCLTVEEFDRLLESLYENGYCLIDINSMYENYVDEDGTVKARLVDYVQVPEGRKPLVLSIDDVVYDSRKLSWGMIDRLVIENGTIMCVKNVNGAEEINDLEVFPRLEKFIEEHPDFSANGAKCTIALTGFEGILGYRTDKCFAERGIDYLAEREQVKPVIEWLLANGYNFACHSYSHADYSTCSQNTVDSDLADWNENVLPLIGKTQIFIYPYGGFTYYGSETHSKLLADGFTVFCGTSASNCLWDGMFPKLGGGYAKNVGNIFLERFTITGYTLRAWAEFSAMHEYCDPYEIYDHENRYEELVKPAEEQ